MSSLADSLLDPGLRFKFLFLRFMLTKALTATVNTTRRTTATGANNTGQRLAEETGLMLVGVAEEEGTTLLVEADKTAFCETLVEAPARTDCLFNCSVVTMHVCRKTEETVVMSC